MSQDTKLTKKNIGLDLMASSKAAITTLKKVLIETINWQLRDTLKNELTTCVNSHYRLSDIAVNKGCYNSSGTPEQQLQKDLSSINTIIQ